MENYNISIYDSCHYLKKMIGRQVKNLKTFFEILPSDRRQIWLLILCEFKQIN